MFHGVVRKMIMGRNLLMDLTSISIIAASRFSLDVFLNISSLLLPSSGNECVSYTFLILLSLFHSEHIKAYESQITTKCETKNGKMSRIVLIFVVVF